MITGQETRICSGKVENVQKVPAPTDITELWKVLAMITYLTKFMPNAKDILQSLDVLLQADVAWTWNREQDAFRKAKKLLPQPLLLAYFDAEKPTVVSADCSSYGIE